MLMVYHIFIMYTYEIGFIVGASIIGFNFGGNFALFPAITADYFGNKNIGSIMDGFFLHMVLQGLLDHLLLDILKIQLKHLQFHHIIAGVACLAGTLVMLRCNPPSLGDRQQSTTVSKKSLQLNDIY